MKGSIVYGMDFTDEVYVKKTVTMMFVSFLTYLISYKVLRRKIPSQGPEYCCRIPTFIHGIISTIAGLYYVVLPYFGYVKGELGRHICKGGSAFVTPHDFPSKWSSWANYNRDEMATLDVCDNEMCGRESERVLCRSFTHNFTFDVCQKKKRYLGYFLSDISIDGAACCIAWLNTNFYWIFIFSLPHTVDSVPGMMILTHSMGYFVFDLLWCFVHGEHPIMKFHHILTVTGLFYFSFKVCRHVNNIFALFLSELTNPLLQVRWFLKHHGLRSGLAFKIVEVTFILSFFLIRVFIMSYYLYRSWLDPSLGMDGADLTFITLGSATSYALAIQMFNYICYQFSKSSKHQKAE